MLKPQASCQNSTTPPANVLVFQLFRGVEGEIANFIYTKFFIGLIVTRSHSEAPELQDCSLVPLLLYMRTANYICIFIPHKEQFQKKRPPLESTMFKKLHSNINSNYFLLLQRFKNIPWPQRTENLLLHRK